MIIKSEIVSQTLNISITGSGDTPYNRKQWRQITEIKDAGPINIHITFYDTLMVHGEIVEDIIKLKIEPRIKSFKIFTLQRSLSAYLNKLGLKNIFIPEKTLKKTKQKKFRAIGVGGSAESLNKIFHIIENLPLADISIFIVQHVPEDTENFLGKLLLIVLSGYGNDGADTLKSAREKGAAIIIEYPQGTEANALPLARINTGYFDYKFLIEEISSFVARNVKKYHIDEEKLSLFLVEIKEKYGYDYADYERESIKRRINLIMINENFSDFEELTREILQTTGQFKTLFLGFSVPVTDFFRNPKVFSHLRENILPSLDSYPHLKIWCAGCASGEGVYSLSILLNEIDLYQKVRVYATDINHYVLMEAQNGLYPAKKMATFIKNYSESGGEKNFQDYFEEKKEYIKIKDFLKEKILFFEHSLVRSGVLNEFQLIFCRNVLIYFKPELQKRVLKLFPWPRN